jgi:transcriptional regulator with XRE-family HTH domain/DNA polymerase III delta prime subunit
MQEYAKRVRRERELHSWSQEQVAEKLGTTAPNVSRWERGKTFPDTYYRQKLCELFGKSAEELGLIQNDADEKREQSPNQVVVQDSHAPVLGASLSMRNQNRQRMLQKIRAFWITGVLEQSLHGAALIILGLHEQPDAVVNPWELVLQQPEQPDHLLPPGTRITQVYDTMGGELLILGEPGSGKTTLLLELARDLLDRAMQDESHPMPVVFNLSSWVVKRQPLADWLVEELRMKYQVPRKLAREWADTEQVLPLLDGLDEVTPSARTACAEAINAFRQEHGLLPTVVCCRSTEYATQKTRLLLQRAVAVQPLTAQQIDTYLLLAGEQLTELHTALQADPMLQELATTPLMLSVLMLAYHGKSVEDLPVAESLETQRRQVFATYVQRMLERRGATMRYTAQQTIHWLAWLSRKMTQHSQTEFYIEHLQPNWLSGVRMRQAYDRWAVRFPAILMGILVSLMIYSLLFPFYFYNGLQPDPDLTLHILLGGFIGWLLGAESTTQQPHENGGKARRGSWSLLVARLRVGVLVGLIVGLSIGLSYGLLFGLSSAPNVELNSALSYGLSYGLVYGLSYGLLFGLGGMLLQAVLVKSNRTGSSFQASQRSRKPKWQHLLKSASVRNGILVGLISALLFGLSSALSFGLSFGLSSAPSVELSSALSFGLSFGLVYGLISGLSSGLIGGFLSMLLIGKPVGITLTDELVWSWRSLRRSLLAKKHRNTTLPLMVLIWLSIGLSSAPSFVLNSAPSVGLIFKLSSGLSFGLSVWLLLGLFQGVSSETIGDQHRVVPNQGIRRSTRNSLVLGLISTGIVGLIATLSYALSVELSSALSSALSSTLSSALSYGLIIGLSAGLLAGLLNGGLACLRHSVVRLLLWRSRAIPWNYPRFLDYAAEHILLRKVGGSYIFVHRLLLEYFASLDTTPLLAEARAQAQQAQPVP